MVEYFDKPHQVIDRKHEIFTNRTIRSPDYLNNLVNTRIRPLDWLDI